MTPLWRRPAVQVAAMIAAATLVKVAVSLELELTSAECYLWMCAQHPALGYYDYPALVAWMIRLSTALFGDGVLAVRLFTILSGAIMTAFVFLAARRLYEERTARLAAFLAGLAPLPFAYGAEALCDSPMLLFWAAALWALAHAFSGGSPAWWYGAGAFLGLSMMGKYHGVFIGVGVLAFLVFSPDHRSWLRRKEPYLAALLALAVFSPTIVWNAQHDWESIRYQGVGRFGERSVDLRELWKFPYSQLTLLTPAIALWAWGSGFRVLRRWRGSPWQDRFAASMSMSVLLFFLGVTLVRGSRGHWAVPGYLAAFILAAETIRRGGPWGRWLNWGSIGILGAAYVLLPLFLAFVPREQLTGWTQLAAAVRTLKPDFVVAREYHHASQMGYLLRPTPCVELTAVGRPSKSFPHWWRGEEHAGRDAVIVFDRKHGMDDLALFQRCFDRLDPPVEVSAPRFAGTPEVFLLIVARGYRPPPPGHRGAEPPPD